MLEVENNSSENPAGYEHLFELDPHLKQTQQCTIDHILLRVSRQAREFHFNHKITVFDLHKQTQDEHYATSARKASLHSKSTGILLDGCAVFFSVGTGFLGGPNTGPGGIFSALGLGFSKTAEGVGNKTRTELEESEHRYQFLGRAVDTHSQQMHAAHSAHGESSKFFEQFMQQEQQLFLSLFQSTS